MRNKFFLSVVALLFCAHLDATLPVPERGYCHQTDTLRACLSMALENQSPIEGCTQLVSAALVSKHKQTRQDTGRFLFSISDQANILVFASGFEQRRVQFGEDVSAILDTIGLGWASRAEIISVYEKAIVDGQVTLPGGAVIFRHTAMAGAAGRGLHELQSLVHEYYDQISEHRQGQLPRDYIDALFELSKNDEPHGRAGIGKALARLDAMGGQEILRRSAEHRGFRLAVRDTLDRATQSSNRLLPELAKRIAQETMVSYNEAVTTGEKKLGDSGPEFDQVISYMRGLSAKESTVVLPE